MPTEYQQVHSLLLHARPLTLPPPLTYDPLLYWNSTQAAIAPDPEGRRRVVLSTNLAESSLTIEGV